MSVLNVNVCAMVNKILKDVHVANKRCQAQGTLSRTETLGIDIASSPIEIKDIQDPNVQEKRLASGVH